MCTKVRIIPPMHLLEKNVREPNGTDIAVAKISKEDVGFFKPERGFLARHTYLATIGKASVSCEGIWLDPVRVPFLFTCCCPLDGIYKILCCKIIMPDLKKRSGESSRRFSPVSKTPTDHIFCSRSHPFKESRTFVINEETSLSSISIL